ncbi:hypothetical protein O6H91_12G050100 [Diphasiastrum complanatum]|uniref:Uncharacterized protein n=1 Tax=Diphasiastrum complanatum TaxID=34168 RepID=A0ACC2C1T1_DIPCM|nr:hypothetical protein O6H91_12G050100 [Diphasiastrum complanatum]
MIYCIPPLVLGTMSLYAKTTSSSTEHPLFYCMQALSLFRIGMVFAMLLHFCILENLLFEVVIERVHIRHLNLFQVACMPSCFEVVIYCWFSFVCLTMRS